MFGLHFHLNKSSAWDFLLPTLSLVYTTPPPPALYGGNPRPTPPTYIHNQHLLHFTISTINIYIKSIFSNLFGNKSNILQCTQCYLHKSRGKCCPVDSPDTGRVLFSAEIEVKQPGREVRGERGCIMEIYNNVISAARDSGVIGWGLCIEIHG